MQLKNVRRYCTRNGRYAIIVSEVCEYANIIPSVIGNAGIRLFEVYLCCVYGHHAVRYVLQIKPDTLSNELLRQPSWLMNYIGKAQI